MPSEPIAERPYMPGYGIPTAPEGLLPWSWAIERLTNARNYFVSTTRPDGRPHTAPVWGCWLEDTLIFSCATNSRKARNLAAEPRCVICPEGAAEAVIVEGVAGELTDATTLERFKEAYDAKYNWDIPTDRGGIYAVRPAVAFGFQELADFQGTATRWRFLDDDGPPTL